MRRRIINDLNEKRDYKFDYEGSRIKQKSIIKSRCFSKYILVVISIHIPENA